HPLLSKGFAKGGGLGEIQLATERQESRLFVFKDESICHIGAKLVLFGAMHTAYIGRQALSRGAISHSWLTALVWHMPQRISALSRFA
ncbi:hypothetical protein, partial [Porphyromonas loveana]|uniref:hypothetical protein n=1 Tax=Porphyromonas loveana TaxID=1884669 RepID=UPI00359FD241